MTITVNYLKDNEKLSISDIAVILRRNKKTIWSSYDKATKKSSGGGTK